MRRFFATLMLFSGMLLMAQSLPSAKAEVEGVHLEDPEQIRRADALINSLMSPFCPGKTLASCTSPAAGDWREEIRAWIAEGLSDDQIRVKLQERVPGHDLLGSPETSLGWALPILLSIATGTALYLLLERLRRQKSRRDRATAEAAVHGELSEIAQTEFAQRVEDELDALDE